MRNITLSAFILMLSSAGAVAQTTCADGYALCMNRCGTWQQPAPERCFQDCQNRQEFCLVSGTFAVGDRNYTALRRAREARPETSTRTEPHQEAAPVQKKPVTQPAAKPQQKQAAQKPAKPQAPSKQTAKQPAKPQQKAATKQAPKPATEQAQLQPAVPPKPEPPFPLADRLITY